MYKSTLEPLYQKELNKQYLRLVIGLYSLYYIYENYKDELLNRFSRFIEALVVVTKINKQDVELVLTVLIFIIIFFIINVILKMTLHLLLEGKNFKKLYKDSLHTIHGINLKKGTKEELKTFKKDIKNLESLKVRDRRQYEDYYISGNSGAGLWSFCEFRTYNVSRNNNGGSSKGKTYGYHIYKFSNALSTPSHFFICTKGSSFLTVKDLQVEKAEKIYADKITAFISETILPIIIPMFKALYLPATKYLKSKGAWKKAQEQLEESQRKYEQNKVKYNKEASELSKKIGSFIGAERIEEIRQEMSEDNHSDSPPQTISIFIICVYLAYTIAIFAVSSIIIETFNLEDILTTIFSLIMGSVFIFFIGSSILARLKYRNFNIAKKRIHLGNERINDIYSIAAQNESNVRQFLSPSVTKNLLSFNQPISIEALNSDLYILIETNENYFELPRWLPSSIDKLLQLHKKEFDKVFEIKRKFHSL
jgi:ABC-type dipeptide/oligopeptide/nickel transport system permease component